jgi:aspartate/methionine/tyrosine aminotransferase
MGLWAVMNLLADRGDNFLFPSPGYPVTLGIANSLGIEPRLYKLEEGKNW